MDRLTTTNNFFFPEERPRPDPSPFLGPIHLLPRQTLGVGERTKTSRAAVGEPQLASLCGRRTHTLFSSIFTHTLPSCPYFLNVCFHERTFGSAGQSVGEN